MLQRTRPVLSYFVLGLVLFGLQGLSIADEPLRLIFDTDIGNDVDDVLALGVIHALQSRGECQLLAVTVTKDDELAGQFVDCVTRSTVGGTFRLESSATG